DLELMHVELFAKNLLDRIDHARMRAEHAERLVIEMRGKGGARRAALLAPHLGTVGVIDVDRLAGEEIDLLLAEQVGQEQPALAVEEFDLLLGQFHGCCSLFVVVIPGREANPESRGSGFNASHRPGTTWANYAATLATFSLSSVIRPAVRACAS